MNISAQKPQANGKKALITGITGQDGSYLTELLLAKGYQVHGFMRRASSFNTQRLDHIYQDPHDPDRRLFLHYADLTDASIISRLVEKINPDEIYNLGAQSHVQVSFQLPEYTSNVDALGTIRLLDSIKDSRINAKFYQAGSSEMFGLVQETPQKETTPFYPRSPYGAAKVFAHWATVNYREAYNLFACNGILFNHESPRRGGTFVTKKIVSAFTKLRLQKGGPVYLGNLEAKRDWGYAKEYVEAMWLMLQQEKPDDYIIATGETHSVREFAETAAALLGFELQWRGSGKDEEGFDQATKTVLVKIDPDYYRPTEVDLLVGDASKAKTELGWEAKTKFREVIKIMVEAELISHAVNPADYLTKL